MRPHGVSFGHRREAINSVSGARPPQVATAAAAAGDNLAVLHRNTSDYLAVPS